MIPLEVSHEIVHYWLPNVSFLKEQRPYQYMRMKLRSVRLETHWDEDMVIVHCAHDEQNQLQFWTHTKCIRPDNEIRYVFSPGWRENKVFYHP